MHTHHTLLGYLRNGRPIYSNGQGGEGDVTTHPAMLANLTEQICDGIGGYHDIDKNRETLCAIAARNFSGLDAQDHEHMAAAFHAWLERDSARQAGPNEYLDERWDCYVTCRNFHQMVAHYLGGRQIKDGDDHF